MSEILIVEGGHTYCASYNEIMHLTSKPVEFVKREGIVGNNEGIRG